MTTETEAPKQIGEMDRETVARFLAGLDYTSPDEVIAGAGVFIAWVDDAGDPETLENVADVLDRIVVVLRRASEEQS